ncbi:MAG: NAD(P)H-hydrate dehydratase [Desulfobacteraceae bacterium]|jgi:NAD(P)H-hydrate repair Nnr-like enzyme with NAD(P)H-hydrate dehydratase domain
MLAVVGTVPVKGLPLIAGEAALDDDSIIIEGLKVPVNRGTPALIAASIKTARVKGNDKIFAFLIGDIGLGDGSRKLYEHLSENLSSYDFDVITFHYLQPDSDWHNRVLFAVDEMKKRPFLIADAGFMYAAKMSGQAPEYDLFTPDAGELAFLADEEAPHPFYTRGFILHEDNNAPNLISRAYSHDNAAKYLLVKGKKDYIANKKGIAGYVEKPSEETMEAIGGTGDTLTGIVSSLIASGMETVEASISAASINRLAGHYAKPDPSTQIIEIIRNISPNLFEKLS